MISRRHLRIKVMQDLYAYFCTDEKDIIKAEKELLSNIAKVEDLFLYQVLLLIEMNHYAWQLLEDAKTKFIPTEEEKYPITKFVNNAFIEQIAHNIEFNQMVTNKKINWTINPEIPRKIFLDFKTTEEYQKYLSAESSYSADKNIVMQIIKKNLFDNEVLLAFYEEMSIYWTDDIYLANIMMLHMLKTINKDFNEHSSFKALYHESEKNEKDDLEMARMLFLKTIIHHEEYEKMISDKTHNWELDRIAKIDILLMKMALCEILKMPTIPTKVTLNEYIDISKMYSTTKSCVFINGILDKIIGDLKNDDKIKKTGRGLM